jgi:Cdc6-like AAA superfamily ATPase
MDERTRSRLSPALVEFPAYTTAEMIAILTDRAWRALLPGSWSTADIHALASAANGNAHVGIQMLHQVAVAAEQSGSSSLDSGAVQRLIGQHQALHSEARLAALTEHQRMIRIVAAQSGPLGASELWRQYRVRCGRENLEPIARRTFTKYLARMGAAGFLNISQRPTGREGRLVRVT